MRVGTPSPVCIPHLGAKLVRKAPDEDEDDADMTRRGDSCADVVDTLGCNVSARVQSGLPSMERATRQVQSLYISLRS